MKLNQLPELTEQQKFEQFMFDFAVLVADLYKTIEEKHSKIFNTFWNGTYDPQLVANALGYEKSYLLLELSKVLQEVLKAGDEEYAPLQVWKTVSFENGQVIISDSITN